LGFYEEFEEERRGELDSRGRKGWKDRTRSKSVEKMEKMKERKEERKS